MAGTKAPVVKSAKFNPNCEGCRAAKQALEGWRQTCAEAVNKVKRLDSELRESANTLRFNSPTMEVPKDVMEIITVDVVAGKKRYVQWSNDGFGAWSRIINTSAVHSGQPWKYCVGWLPTDGIKVEIQENETTD